MGEPIEQCCRHLGVSEDRRPFAGAEVGGDDHTGALLEFAEKVEQRCAARGAERQVSQLIQDHEICLDERFSYFPGLA